MKKKYAQAELCLWFSSVTKEKLLHLEVLSCLLTPCFVVNPCYSEMVFVICPHYIFLASLACLSDKRTGSSKA